MSASVAHEQQSAAQISFLPFRRLYGTTQRSIDLILEPLQASGAQALLSAIRQCQQSCLRPIIVASLLLPPFYAPHSPMAIAAQIDRRKHGEVQKNEKGLKTCAYGYDTVCRSTSNFQLQSATRGRKNCAFLPSARSSAASLPA